MAACGIRINEAMGVALEDFDFGEGILHLRRHVKKLGTEHVYALPKNDREREVPLPDWVATAVKMHIAKYPPRPCTLPWEKLTGRPRSHNILFRWGDGNHVRYRTDSEQVWKPVIARAGIIPEPGTDKRGRKRYVTTRKEGPHQCRHSYASVMLADGSQLRSWRSTSATTTLPSRCGSIPIRCLVPMTAPGA
jgi:integrase